MLSEYETIIKNIRELRWVCNVDDLIVTDENTGNTVAHYLAGRGKVFTDHAILSLADDRGKTVAHILANNGHVFEDKDILKLKCNYGITVLNVMKKVAKNKNKRMIA
jgi:uncharacterized protein YrrD